MRNFENGDLFATVKVVLETVDEEGNVKQKIFGSVSDAEKEAMLFTGILQETPYLEPCEVEMINKVNEKDNGRIFFVVSIDGEYRGWTSEAGLSGLKDFAGEPVIVLSGDEDGNHYTVNEWVIFYNPDNHKFVCEREGETHRSDNFWDIVGKCKNSK